ncbi:proteoglycan 4 [Contarinia nasturtii]|uniref:proteoglycan 4 n=1 Tax=Contarinia nasturtii TaxID=265458 RepID=UPI0012D40396|nr:proteoglycan 4 [Contarinia nasturtii]XP_031623659.1 proteoglycan 4 [Contarinia nasturtii]XP_031623660.1 proteoglycan 4 [Contarinia nasturtii]
MDTVYGTKKYFQSLGDNDYYNRHSSSTNRVMQAACTSYQNTIGRHSTIGPYSHLSGNPYTANGCNNDFSYTNQYGYNSWGQGLWRDSRNLTPSSTYSSKSRSSIKSFTIILMTAAFIVILAVLSVAALAFYFSTFKSDDSIMIFDGKFQVTRGDVFTTGLKYNHTNAYQKKVDHYRNLITESLERNGLTVYKCDIHGFGTGPLVQVDFRVFLDMRKVPRTIRSVEEHIRDSLLKEIMSSKSTKGIQIDLPTLEIKRSLDTEVLNSASFVRERVTTPSSIMFDDKSRKAPSSTLISKPSKITTSKPKSKLDIVEAEIDIENTPILQGSFEVTKTDADITEKKIRTSTLKPFTITNGSVRMKPKKTTVEKVKPLPKVPENLTANIMKIENVTKAFHFEKVTTPRPTITTEEIPTSAIEIEVRPSTEASTTTTTTTTTKAPTTPLPQKEVSSTTTTTEVNTPSVVLPSEPPPSPPQKSVEDLSTLEGEILSSQNTKKNFTNLFPSAPVLDDQPWLPIAPNAKIDHNLNDAKKKIHNSLNPPVVPSNYNADSIGMQLLPRNKMRNPIPSSVQKTSRPPVYHSFNNPALMYGLHEVEKLGLGVGFKYPLPVDLIGEQSNKKDDLILNRGEVLPSIKETPILNVETTTVKMTTTPVYEKANESKTNETITLNMEETTDRAKNKTELGIDDEITNQQVGEILLDLLKDSNVKLNETNSDDLIMQSRTDELELHESKKSEVENQTEKVNLSDDEVDHTEAFDEIATVLSSMETLSFKNIKDYIMATTKSITKDILATSTERDQTTPRREKPQNTIDPMVKSDRISLIAPTTPANLIKPMTQSTSGGTTASTSVHNQDVDPEAATASYVEVETVQYTPGASATWTPGLFPVQSKWEYVNGTLVYPSVAPMRKIFNETLQAWIIENPTEATERLPPTELVRNTSEPIKNISAIFDTLASKLNMNSMDTVRMPPFMAHFSANKLKNEHHPLADYLTSTTKRSVPQTTILPASSSASTPEDELPILLNQNTESYYGSSAETLIGQAEVEEVDPTQYEQMLLIDKVSAALHPSSTVPSLVTLMPVKSNSGIRNGFINDKAKGSGRGFPPTSQSTSNRRRFEDASFVVRTSMNISS